MKICRANRCNKLVEPSKESDYNCCPMHMERWRQGKKFKHKDTDKWIKQNDELRRKRVTVTFKII